MFRWKKIEWRTISVFLFPIWSRIFPFFFSFWILIFSDDSRRKHYLWNRNLNVCLIFFFSRAGRKWIGFLPSVTEIFSSFAKIYSIWSKAWWRIMVEKNNHKFFVDIYLSFVCFMSFSLFLIFIWAFASKVLLKRRAKTST